MCFPNCRFGTVLISADLVANSSDCSNDRLLIAQVNFVAEIVDIDVYYVCESGDVCVPDFLDDRSAGNGPPKISQEKIEQGIFLGAEVDGFPPRLTRWVSRLTSRSANRYVFLSGREWRRRTARIRATSSVTTIGFTRTSSAPESR